MKPLHIILTSLLLLASHPGAWAADKPQQQWEYKVFAFKTTLESLTAGANAEPASRSRRGDPVALKVEETLNKLGAEGWELCSESGGVLIFKRAKAG